MKILLIDVNCKYSSTGKIVYELYRGGRSKQHQVHICYGRGSIIHENGIYKFGLDWETVLHAGLSRVTGYNGYFSYFSTRNLIRYIDRYKPDLIHIHELHAYFVNIKPLIDYIKKKHIKLIWTFHCEYMYTGKCGHANSCLKYETECGHCPELHAYPKSILFDQTKMMFQMKKKLLSDLEMIIVCPSQWLAGRVKRSFLKSKPINVIFNGVDTNIFYPRDVKSIRNKFEIPMNNRIILSVAPDILSDRKGGEEIIRLSDRFKHVGNITFILVGAKKNEAIRRSNLIVLPNISGVNLLAELYSAADIFLLCSKKETFSLTCAESLCCGTRVIGYKCGAPETIFNSFAQFVDQGNLDELEKQIQKTLNTPWTMEMRQKCAEESKRCYGIGNMVNSYFRLYEEITR